MKDELQRKLTLPMAVSVVVGSAIGSGIFKKPALMASQLGSPTLLIFIWALAGVLTLFGSLSNAEVAGLFPETGGQFYFFRKMYGGFTGYLYGWAVFAVIQTGSIASIAYIFGESSGYFFNLPRLPEALVQAWVLHIPFVGNVFPLAFIGVKLVAIGLVVFLTVINYLGVVLGGTLQTVITGVKVFSLAALVAFAFVGHGSFSHFGETLPTMATTSTGLFAAIVAALSGAFWAYDGWNNVTFVAGEIQNPQKNLPRSLLFGTWIVIVVYVLINVAFLYALPIGTLAQSKLAAADAARASLGDWGQRIVLIAIFISTFGACNGSLMASARVYFAMAREKMFFPSIGLVQHRFKTPGNALIIQCVWTALLILSGTFDALTDMLIFVTWIFYAAGAYGVFVLRRKMPDAPRPYRVPGYPYVPAFFVLFASVFVVQTLVNDIGAYNRGETPIINSVFGLLLTLIGAPLYFYFTRGPKRVSPS